MNERVLVDLFCGVGGWSKPFLRLGWRCIGFDLWPRGYPGEWRQRELPMDVAELLSLGPDVVVASPPCETFARQCLPWLRRPSAVEFNAALRLLRWSVDLVDRLDCPVLVECSRFAARFCPGGYEIGNYALWGSVPAVMPDLPRGKSRLDGRYPERRAEIPAVLADHVAWCFASNRGRK